VVFFVFGLALVAVATEVIVFDLLFASELNDSTGGICSSKKYSFSRGYINLVIVLDSEFFCCFCNVLVLQTAV
jgi:hypothetical protein